MQLPGLSLQLSFQSYDFKYQIHFKSSRIIDDLGWRGSPAASSPLPAALKTTANLDGGGSGLFKSSSEYPLQTLHNLSGSLLLHLTTLMIKIAFLVCNQNFPCSNLCTFPLILLLCTSEESESIFSVLSHQSLRIATKIHLSLLFARQNKFKSSTCSLISNQTGVIWYSVKLTFFIGTSLTIVGAWLMDRTLTNPTYCKFVLPVRIKPGKKQKYFIYAP